MVRLGKSKFQVAAISALGFAVLICAAEQPFVDASSCSLSLTEPALRTLGSHPISPLTVGEYLVIATTITGCGEDERFVAIAEVRNSEGVTESLTWYSIAFNGTENVVDAGFSWVPIVSDDYELRVFAISGFDSPQVLSPVMTASVSIAEAADRTTVVIPYDQDPASQQVTFEPSVLKVILGVNNTVVWTNGDKVSHKIKPDPSSPNDFEFATRQIFLYPGNRYEHVFAEAGSYHYADADREWMHGIIWVIPNEAMQAYLNFTVNGLQDSYKAGKEAVEFSFDITGFETDCGTVRVIMERIDEGRQEDPFEWSAGAVYDCLDVSAPYKNTRLHLPFHEHRPVYEIPVDKPGTYRLTTSFENHYTFAYYSMTKDFLVTQ